MKKFALFAAPLFASSLAVAPMAMADTSTGIYSGVGVGSAQVHDADVGSFSSGDLSGDRITDNNDTAQSAFVGYKFNDWFSTEINYADLGDIDYATDQGNGRYQTKAYSLSAIGELPLFYGVSGYARVGAAYWKANAQEGPASNQYGTDPVYGLGLKYQFETIPVFARAEYTRYDMDSDYRIDAAMASVGVQF
ncbi:outer membrane beta-barrel protein [Kushneria indalinina]|uniref:OmpA family protein n=1 Tax=Kushneria indalinina DSM 14324 TaxID=1122140 RepID=A0A3D9DZD2_9GAMM|nr:outer membrane beta-barrel protein [Kushneria indalinina]REC96128.1 OmpA family protein [Kushneria indalinina DSM 14324]